MEEDLKKINERRPQIFLTRIFFKTKMKTSKKRRMTSKKKWKTTYKKEEEHNQPKST